MRATRSRTAPNWKSAQHARGLRSGDARTGLDAGRWTAFLFVDDLTDKRALYSNTGALSANVAIFNRSTTNPPRTIGADLNDRF